MLEHAAGDPDEVLARCCPAAGHRHAARRGAINTVLAGLPAGRCSRWCSPRSARSAQPGGEPARRERDHAPGRADGHRARRDRRRRRVQRRGRRVRARATAPTRPSGAPCGCCMLHVAGARPGFGRRGDARASPRSTRSARRRTSTRRPWEGYAAQPRRRRAERGHRALRRGSAQRARHGEADGDPQLILDKIASAMTSLGMNNAPISQGEFFVILGPEHAHEPRRARLHPRRRRVVPVRPRPHPGRRRSDRHFEELAWAQWMKTVARRPPVADDRRPRQHPGARGRAVPASTRSLVPSWGMTRSVTLPVEG